MHRYYFHDRLDETITKDSKGVLFQDDETAVHHAVERTHILLKAAIRRKSGIDTATEISNGTRTIYVVRGKIAAEECAFFHRRQANFDELLQRQRATSGETSRPGRSNGNSNPLSEVSRTDPTAG